MDGQEFPTVYRVARTPGPTVIGDDGIGPEDYYTLVQVYEQNGEVRHDVEPAYPIGISVEELREDLMAMLAALDYPVLEGPANPTQDL